MEASVTTEYKEYLTKCVEEVLSVPHELLNGLPVCPFARQAIIENKVEFFRTSDYVKDIANKLDNWDDSIHALVFVCDDDVDPKQFVVDVKKLNLKYLDENLVLLEDHTKVDEPFHGIKFNNGKYNIVIAQRLKSINEASKHLARNGYYINWSDDMYNDVVRWRFESEKS